jgi:hypothetical protein
MNVQGAIPQNSRSELSEEDLDAIRLMACRFGLLHVWPYQSQPASSGCRSLTAEHGDCCSLSDDTLKQPLAVLKGWDWKGYAAKALQALTWTDIRAVAREAQREILHLHGIATTHMQKAPFETDCFCYSVQVRLAQRGRITRRASETGLHAGLKVRYML